MSRDERVRQALIFLSRLTNVYQPVLSIARQMSQDESAMKYIFRKLNKANLVDARLGAASMVRKLEGATFDDNTIRGALGYTGVGDTSEVSCAQCKQVKTRTIVRKTAKKYRYVDGDGRRWKGKVCPECRIQNSYVSIVGPDPITNRRCRGCHSKLPTSRYFDCYICKPTLSVTNDEHIYHGNSLDFGGGLDEFDISDVPIYGSNFTD